MLILGLTSYSSSSVSLNLFLWCSAVLLPCICRVPCDLELQFDVASSFVAQVYRVEVRLLLFVLLISDCGGGF
jgi:hypothetical protein